MYILRYQSSSVMKQIAQLQATDLPRRQLGAVTTSP